MLSTPRTRSHSPRTSSKNTWSARNPGWPVYLTEHLVSSLIRRDEEKWYGDIALLGEQIAHPQYA